MVRGVGGRPPPPPAPPPSGGASIDPEKLRQEIRAGVRLRPTQTIDKSKPFIQAEGEVVKVKRLPVLEASPASTSFMPPPPPPPLIHSSPLRFAGPPPPPPPMIQRSGKIPELPKASLKPGDRDRLLVEIKQGRRLRHVETVDKSRPVVRADEGFEESPPPQIQTLGHHSYRDEYQPLTPPQSSDTTSGTSEELYVPQQGTINGFTPSYGKLSASLPPPPPPIVGHSPTPSTTSSEKVKPDIGFYDEAPPPPPSLNPLVDESSYAVGSMVGVFDSFALEEEERERQRTERLSRPLGRVNSAMFEQSRSASMSQIAPARPRTPVGANGTIRRTAPQEDRVDGADEEGYVYNVTPNGTRYRSRSRAGGRASLPANASIPANMSAAASERPVFRADSPPRFAPDSFPMPESFHPEELLKNRYVSPVATEPPPSAKHIVAAFETRAKAEPAAKSWAPPRVVAARPHPAAKAFQEEHRKPAEQVYSGMATGKINGEKFTHDLPVKSTGKNDFSKVPWRPSYSGPQSFMGVPPSPTSALPPASTLPRRSPSVGPPSATFQPQELIHNRYVPDPRHLPDLTPTSERVVSEVQSALGGVPGLRRRSGSRGAAEMERTHAEVHIRRAEDEPRQMEESRTDLLIRPGSSRALASQFEQRDQPAVGSSQRTTPVPFAARHRSASHHQLFAEPQGPPPQGQPSYTSQTSWQGQNGGDLELQAELPSVADLRGTFESGYSQSGSLPRQAGAQDSSAPWARSFQDQRAKFLPDVGRIADAFEDRAASVKAARLRSASTGRRFTNGEVHSPEDSSGVSSQASSLNGEARYPAAFCTEEPHPPPHVTQTVLRVNGSPAHIKTSPQAQATGPVPWRITKRVEAVPRPSDLSGGSHHTHAQIRPGGLGFPVSPGSALNGYSSGLSSLSPLSGLSASPSGPFTGLSALSRGGPLLSTRSFASESGLLSLRLQSQSGGLLSPRLQSQSLFQPRPSLLSPGRETGLRSGREPSLLSPSGRGGDGGLLSPTRDDVFALRDFHAAQLADLQHSYSSRLLAFRP